MRELRDVEIRPQWLDENSSFTAVGGSLDLDGAAELKRVFTDFREEGANRFVLDLSRVRFIDSTGLGVLIGLNRQLRGRGALVITAPSPAVTRLLQVTGVSRILNVFPSWDDATAFLGPLPDPAPEDQRSAPHARPAPTAPSATLAEQSGPGSETYPGRSIPLSGDATMALGIATTAMPFARSAESQAERWLRILRGNGDAGVILASLGISDESATPEAEPRGGPDGGAVERTDPDPVASVTRSACRLAEERQASTVQSSDLLEAVKLAYGSAFERVLARHATERTGLIGQLEHLLSDRRSPTADPRWS